MRPAVEEVAGIRTDAEIGELGRASIEREVRGRSGNIIRKQPRTLAGETVEIKDVRLRTIRLAIWHATHRMRQLMQGYADQQVWIDVGGKAGVAVGTGGGGTEEAEQLQLGVPDHDSRLSLDRRARGQGIERSIVRRRVGDQIAPHCRIAYELTT